MNCKTALNLISAIFLTASMLACSQDSNLLPNEKGGISFSISETNHNFRHADVGEPKFILLSIKDMEGDYIYNMRKIDLFNMNGQYLTENIELPVADYTVEDFAVLDQDASIIYLTPKSGSEFEDYVSTPLPHSFSITPDNVNNVVLEVLPSDFGGLDKFGYAKFSLQIVKHLKLRPNSSDGKDARVDSWYGDENWGDREDLMIKNWTIDGRLSRTRAYLDFDFTDIPAGATIKKASLSLYHWPENTHSKLSGSNACWINRVTEAWGEGEITWNTQPSFTSVNRISMEASETDNEDYLDIDILPIVNDIVNSPAGSDGIMIQLKQESGYRALYFCSSDYHDPDKRPKLEVIYSY